MERFKTFIREKRLLVAPAIGVASASFLPVISNASGGDNSETDAVTSALTTAFSGVQDSATSYITTALPYALGIMALVLGITIAVKAFKRFAK